MDWTKCTVYMRVCKVKASHMNNSVLDIGWHWSEELWNITKYRIVYLSFCVYTHFRTIHIHVYKIWYIHMKQNVTAGNLTGYIVRSFFVDVEWDCSCLRVTVSCSACLNDRDVLLIITEHNTLIYVPNTWVCLRNSSEHWPSFYGLWSLFSHCFHGNMTLLRSDCISKQ